MLKICILDSKTLGEDIDLGLFNKFGQVNVYKSTRPEEVEDRIRDVDIIVTNKFLLNESNLKGANRLKLICITATGTNNVDLNYIRSRGIAVTNVAGYSTQSVVQHTFAMLFYLMESLEYYDKYVKSGEYAKSDIFTHHAKPFGEIWGKAWGIIGLGTIGKSVANVATAFGARVVYYSTSGKNNSSDFERVELDELLKTSDIISIHAPLNENTLGLIDYNSFKMMKRDAYVLNLGRGGIINEKALAEALDENLIKGAATDVLGNEPIKDDNPLLNLKESSKLFITPHIAWASYESRMRLVNEVYLNIDAFLKGEERNRV